MSKDMKSWKEFAEGLDLDFGRVKHEYLIDPETYDKLHMVYCLMRDLLIEMKSFGDLDGYDDEDIFKLIGELEENN